MPPDSCEATSLSFGTNILWGYQQSQDFSITNDDYDFRHSEGSKAKSLRSTKLQIQFTDTAQIPDGSETQVSPEKCTRTCMIVKRAMLANKPRSHSKS